MKSGLFGVVATIITFPGALLFKKVQAYFDDRYSVPAGQLAVWGHVDMREIKQNRTELSKVARVLGKYENPKDGEHVTEFVDYEGMDDYRDMFSAVLTPFFLMTAIAAVLFSLFTVLRVNGFTGNIWLWCAGVYPGFVIAVHAFPNTGPTMALWQRTEDLTGVNRVICIPIVGATVLLNGTRVVWGQGFYAFVLFWFVSTVFGVPL